MKRHAHGEAVRGRSQTRHSGSASVFPDHQRRSVAASAGWAERGGVRPLPRAKNSLWFINFHDEP